jgi:Mg-chelatase subunit ChlI
MSPEAAAVKSRLRLVRFDPKVLEEVASRILGLGRRRTLLVGIDGRGGSGKSTFARELAALLPNATVVQFDDFYRPADERRLRAASGKDEVKRELRLATGARSGAPTTCRWRRRSLSTLRLGQG